MKYNFYKSVGAKKATALALAAAMTMGIVPAAYAADKTPIKDIPSNWAKTAVENAVENDLMTGYEGYVRPFDNITRAEVSVIVNKILAAEDKADISHITDVSEDDWFCEAMSKIVKTGILSGNGKQLMPNNDITRQEAFCLVARMLGLTNGSENILDTFADKNDIAAWAKSSIASLVEAGYISGSDGKINPTEKITRAEFAQVLSNIADKYIFEEGEVTGDFDGNVFVGAKNVTLSGNVKGNIVLGDGADKTSLKNLNVKGDVLSRGGDVSFENTKVDGNLVISGSDSTPEIKTDDKTEITSVKAEKDYSAEKAFENQTGEGKNIYSKADDKTSTSADTKKTSSGGGGGSSSSSSGGSSSGGSSSGGSTVTKTEIVDAEKATVISDDAGTWLPLVFKDGFTSADVTSVKADGTDVTSSLSNVTTEGTVAKLPLVSTPKKVEITSKGKTQTITLNGTGEASVYTGSEYLPDYYLVHGPIPAWDYYLSNYDNEGNLRIHPSRTTFSLTEEKEEHPSYSPDAELITDESGLNVSGNVIIMFNYNTDAEKEWFNGINQLELVQYDENKTTLNANLEYKSDKDVDHYGGKIGQLTIPIGQGNFRSNGRYYVRVKSSNGSTALVEIHVVNQTAPNLVLKETPASGRNLHMAMENMVYGITQPIESVTLTDPTGTTRELEKITDWYLIGDLFVIYNDDTAQNGRNNFEYSGNYTVTVRSNGFKTISKTFNVSDGKDVPTSNQIRTMSSFDAVSMATSGGSSDGSGDSSGSYSVSADLFFNSDLLANALILDKLNIENKGAKTVVDYWSNTIFDAVLNKGETTYYTSSGYLDAVNGAKVSGKKWLAFGEYVKSDNAKTTPNRPHSVKEVLEDGLLGEIQYSNSYARLNAPKATVSEAKEGHDVVITFENAADYMNKISSIKLNGDYSELSKENYTIENNALTIKAGTLSIGENSLVIDAAGYMSNIVKINYAKETEKDLSLSVATPISEGGDIVITVDNSEGDFLGNLSGVVLKNSNGTEKQVYVSGYEGSNAVCYVLSDDKKKITIKNADPETYTVSISANYYDTLTTEEFTIERTTPLVKAPTVKAHEKKAKKSLERTDYYRLTFNGMNANALDSYLNAITKVTVGSTEYSKDSFYFDENNYRAKTIDDSQVSKKDCLDLAENGINATEGTVITVEAKGYETMTYTLKGESSVVKPDPSKPETSKDAPTVSAGVKQDKGSFDSYARYRFTFKGMSSSDLTAYLGAITEVTVEETSYSPISGLGMGESMYKIGTSGYSGYNYIELADNAFKTSEETTIVIKADGYKDLTIKFDVTNPIKADAPTATVTKTDDTTYHMTFTGMEADELKTYLTAVKNSSTVVTVGGKIYTAGFYSLSEKNYLVKDSESTYGSNYDCIDFHANDGFAASGDTKIVITAPGYKDLKCTYSAGDNSGTETPDQPDQSETTLKVAGCTYNEAYSMEVAKYRLTFSGISESELKNFLDSITEVTVNENKYNEKTLFLGASEYTKAETSGSGYDCLDIAANGFNASGDTVIVIKSKLNGEAVTITYTYNPNGSGSTETPDNGNDSGNTSEGKETPAVADLSFNSGGLYADTYRLLFTGSVDDYFNAISSVSVNENVYTGIAYSWDFKEKNYITKPNDKYIDFTPDGFSDGENKIVIKATGYKDLKYTYTK